MRTTEVRGVARPDDDGYTFGQVDDTFRVYANKIEDLVWRYLDDFADLTDILQVRLREDTLAAIEADVLSGDGLEDRFTGVLETSGVQVHAFTGDLLGQERELTGWALNPLDLMALEALRENGDDELVFDSTCLWHLRGFGAKLRRMNRSQKVAVTVCVLVVAGLAAVAAPAVASVASDIGGWALFNQPAADAPADASDAPADAAAVPADEPVASPAPIPDRTHGDCALLYYPTGPSSIPRLDAPIDNGPREFAIGEVGLVDGIPTTYTVAPGDAIQGIGARFCVFGTGLFYLNEVHLQGTIQPGDVLRLRP
ncbi:MULTISPECIES: hypothetical protein [Microbacterium]|uniref:LysM domain-containing protein n=1 Tax=Microbacterium profundi TaxID=450380 RepID=A0ABV3LGT5_9MICO|nr:MULTISPECIES: hypothetical protein [Microbacterium]MCE7481909.1 phage major capsid protein [Microbacterium profundi]